VQLAERVNGPIPTAVDFGATLSDELRRATINARIINLETGVSKSREYAPKGIN